MEFKSKILKINTEIRISKQWITKIYNFYIWYTLDNNKTLN